jgi:antitoxin (DNA-binding transcriptional repressor) of toxin-antitoxin stability system
LLDQALAGEEVVIARAGKPLAQLTPVESMTQRRPGAWRDLKIPNDTLFEPMDPDELDAAEGKHTQ